IVQFNNKNYGLFLTFIPNSHKFDFFKGKIKFKLQKSNMEYEVEHPDFTALENFIKSLEKFEIIRRVL
ncbi:MAG: hypothetical protein QXI58_08570, partial [Candidatus Micrarchaeia archaeon]